MKKRAFHILLSTLLMGGLLWIALINVDPAEFVGQLSQIRVGWIPAFIVALIVAHVLRAERWRLLIQEGNPPGSTLFAGVMVGYMANYLLPRLGEISRPVYVARQEERGSGGLFATIVVERAIDLASLAFLFGLAVLFYGGAGDAGFGHLFGSSARAVWFLIVITLLLFSVFAGVWIVSGWLRRRKEKIAGVHPILAAVALFLVQFRDGVSSVRRVKQWPLFLVYTLGIWTAYTVMTWLPFSMLDLQETYRLGLREAAVITIVSAVGVSIPTPGGAGSYHLLVQQAMWLLYAVPLTTGLTYATVTHAITLIVVILVGVISLWIDKRHRLNRAEIR